VSFYILFKIDFKDMVFKKVLAKNKKTSGRLEYRFSSTVNISFFCPFTMVYFLILLFIFSAQFFYKSKHFLITKEKGIIFIFFR